jgi:hypothetical protein
MNNGIICITLELKSTRNCRGAVEKFLAIKAMPLTWALLERNSKCVRRVTVACLLNSVPGHSLEQDCWNVKVRC